MLNLNNSAISVTTIFYRIRNNSVDLFEVSYAIGRGFPNDFNKGLPHVRMAEMTEEYD